LAAPSSVQAWTARFSTCHLHSGDTACSSGVACAVLLWQELWKETHEETWLDSIRTGMNFCLMMQRREQIRIFAFLQSGDSAF